MARFKNVNWDILSSDGRESGNPMTEGGAQLAVLMDIRGELQRLNSLLHCANFIQIPSTLRSINRKLTKPKRKKLSK